jgi:transposase
MSRVNTPNLDEKSKKVLELEYRRGKSHSYRSRCQVILLKSEGRSSKEVGKIVKMCAMTVNTWVNRYKSEGIEGLKTKAGRGRKSILNKSVDEASVVEAVKNNRQRMDHAKADWEASQPDKKASRATFLRFLKSLADGTKESAGVAKENPKKHFTNSK